MASYGVNVGADVLFPVLPARYHEMARTSQMRQPQEASGRSRQLRHSRTRGPAWPGAPRSAVWPRAPTRHQRKRPAWKHAEIRTQKPALQPKDREMGRLPKVSGVSTVRLLSSQTAQKKCGPAPSPPAEGGLHHHGAEDNVASTSLGSGWSRLRGEPRLPPRLTVINTPAWGQQPACYGQVSEIHVLQGDLHTIHASVDGRLPHQEPGKQQVEQEQKLSRCQP